MQKHRYKNELAIARHKMRLRPKQVVSLIGGRSRSALSRWETGETLPNLITALKLEILYRVPIAFLYPELYRTLQSELRAQERAQVRGGLAIDGGHDV